ncbi:unnamed protein product [Gordionus sp. m RMFG-2023]|uniref:vesicle-fusing ATPase 1-like n=1 Tax=Gordionus sp. m RMFG-2023 TaxID=3053472 RepID=UPI0030E4BDEF
METRKLRVVKLPSEDLSYTNCAAVNVKEYPVNVIHIEINSCNRWFVFSIRKISDIQLGSIGFSLPHRKWASLSIEALVDARPFKFNPKSQYISKIRFNIDFWSKKVPLQEPFDTDKMANDIMTQYSNVAFSIDQQIPYNFMNKKLLSIVVKELECADVKDKNIEIKKQNIGILMPNSIILFDKPEDSSILLTGKSRGKVSYQSIINPDWDFQKMGIGGLDTEFSAIFRRAFASRVFPPEVIELLGCKHVKGILLFGPPGTGKTLMARQIGKMLNSREPIIVNGPQILDKYVGESEANIRKLFAPAEEEEKRLGPMSGLHIIIFDEIDAICKSRGSVAGNTGVHDTVVNQLLAKIDGVDQLNNILVIGMTNRKDMIDDALLRPGRLEVQMEIGLPSEEGRLQIIKIHTAKMVENKKLASDVDLKKLAELTRNFSGAEIEGLVRAAQSSALNRLIKATNKVKVDPDAIEKIMIGMDDFLNALENDIKPSFGASYEQVENYISHGIITWGKIITEILEDGDLFVQQVKNSESKCLISVLLDGTPGSGKTALAAKIALTSNFPFVKVVSPEDMIAFTEPAKCQYIKKIFDDAYKSELSCIIVDDIERLLEYSPVGPRYSNLVLQTLLILLKKEPPYGSKGVHKRMLVLGTTSEPSIAKDLGIISAFTSTIRIFNLSTGQHVINVLEVLDFFEAPELEAISNKIRYSKCFVGIKKLIAIADLSRQSEPLYRAIKFISKMEEEGGLQLHPETYEMTDNDYERTFNGKH